MTIIDRKQRQNDATTQFNVLELVLRVPRQSEKEQQFRSAKHPPSPASFLSPKLKI